MQGLVYFPYWMINMIVLSNNQYTEDCVHKHTT